MRRLCSRWLPRLLTIDQKSSRVTTLEHNLAYFNCNPQEFLRQFVTIDETWKYHYTPESREGSKQWVELGETVPKRPKTQQSARKVMASVFGDAHGVILIDYIEKERTTTRAYYAALLDRLVDEIRKKRPHLMRKKSFFMMTMHHPTHRTFHRKKSIN